MCSGGTDGAIVNSFGCVLQILHRLRPNECIKIYHRNEDILLIHADPARVHEFSVSLSRVSEVKLAPCGPRNKAQKVGTLPEILPFSVVPRAAAPCAILPRSPPRT